MPSDIKVLGVGFMKTGLTSVLREMRAQGFRCQGKSRKLFKAFARGDISRVMEAYETGDFFIDWPQPYMYRPFLRRYGKRARFILTVRDEASWFASLVRHNEMAHPITHSHRLMFGRFYPSGFEEEHCAIYRAHNQAVIDYFEAENAMEQLLVIDVSKPGEYVRFCVFLGLEPRGDSFSRANVSADKKPRNAFYNFRKAYNSVVQPIYARYAPRLFPKARPILQSID